MKLNLFFAAIALIVASYAFAASSSESSSEPLPSPAKVKAEDAVQKQSKPSLSADVAKIVEAIAQKKTKDVKKHQSEMERMIRQHNGIKSNSPGGKSSSAKSSSSGVKKSRRAGHA